MFRLKVRLHGQDVQEIALESGREYVFGRGSDCDVQLQDEAGISRQHFKVFEENGGWIARVVSKFGDINVGGSPVQSAQLDIGSVVKLNGYDFIFLEQQQNKVVQLEQPDEEAQPVVQEVRSVANLPATFTPNMPFEGSDEATRVMEVATTGEPYLRIVEPSGREETIKVDGAKWIAGREEGSQILLNDRKASRRQFELMKSPQGNFVRDLGSSNGTLLNGMPLAPDELKPLKSGDVLQVGQLAIHLEVRDPHFERRLQIVPKQVLDAQMPVPQTPAYEIINYPIAQGPGGAVRVGAAGVPMPYEAPQAEAWDQAREVKEAKAKKFRFYIIVVAVAAGAIYFLSEDDGPKKPTRQQQQAQAQTPQEQAFAKLTPQKQQFVKEAYILGHNLFMQSKMALAAEQFAKIHELLKDGYMDSRQLADECEAQAQQERNRLEVEEQMRQAAQNRVIVVENLKKCEPISNSSFSVDELKSCLAPTYERDPGNSAIESMILKITNRVAQRDAKIAGQKAYSSKVARGRELYEKAVAIEKRGDGDGAVEAYRAHLNANLPDPDGLRALSMKKVGSITATKQASIKSYMQAAEAAYNSKDWKTAITNINKVKGLDPYNMGAAELNGRINREKDQKLREMYEDSILNEGLGQIEQAKATWKKIIEQDHPDGVYYKRAKNKLRSLGGS